MYDVVLWSVIWTLVLAGVRQRRHLDSLRRQLGPDGIDVWTLRCQHCARLLRRGRTLACVETREYLDGKPSRRIVRAWHADRPACAAAFATDDKVMHAYLNGSQ